MSLYLQMDDRLSFCPSPMFKADSLGQACRAAVCSLVFVWLLGRGHMAFEIICEFFFKCWHGNEICDDKIRLQVRISKSDVYERPLNE
jgi:hypothetical protein